ncbi:hypothetical protein [Ligaoa zhengdingensis]|uniref:hypothetical protein n=1 Tax=Ligaoa zhengdingensis TaxID=2763658 RepID=UPI0031BA5F14
MSYYDLHTHSVLSDGELTVAGLVQAAKAHGVGLGVSDHLFCPRMPAPRDVERYLDELERHEGVLRGLEADLGSNFTLPGRIDRRVDYVIASVHSVQDLKGGERIPLGPYFAARAGDEGAPPYARVFSPDEAKRYLEQILGVFAYDLAAQRVDILGHCVVNPFYDVLRGDPWLTGWEDEVITLCKRHGVAMEVSSLWNAPDEGMLRRATGAGVQLSLGSDCHRPGQAGCLDWPVAVTRRLGLAAGDLYLPQRKA